MSPQAVLLLLVAFVPLLSALDLDGAPGSYARFPPWRLPCRHNGSLSLEFSTRHPSGLILYTDSFPSDFVELKLVRGALRLRFRDGVETGSLSTGSDYSYGKWHQIELRKTPTGTVIVIDGVPHSPIALTLTEDAPSANPTTQSGFLYVGGLPAALRAQTRRVVLASVAFEPGFKGSIRGLALSHCGAPRQEVAMVDGSGLRIFSDDACADHDPCRNGGECISTDAGSVCDCRLTDYTGITCDEGTFSATSFGR